jgi:RNA polymerase sigma factor (sigma-70 family)
MSLDVLTDKDLLARFIRENDQDAFAQIVQRHGAMVFGICCRLCITRDDAEDAAQYVFITLATKAPEFHARTCLAGWLHRTANHIARRWRRSADTRRRHEYEAGALRPDFIQGEAGLDQDEAIDQLQRALGALPEDYRNALILHHLEGHTVEQVAQLLATPPGTIAARLSRGRAMLRQRLVIMGVILSTIDFDQLLQDALSEPDTAPVSLRETSYPAPPASAFRSAGAKACLGVGAATPAAYSMKTTAAILFTLVSSTVAGATTYCALNCIQPGPTPAVRASALDPEPEPSYGVSSRGYSVPEPSSLSIVAPAALLLLRRNRRWES